MAAGSLKILRRQQFSSCVVLNHGPVYGNIPVIPPSFNGQSLFDHFCPLEFIKMLLNVARVYNRSVNCSFADEIIGQDMKSSSSVFY